MATAVFRALADPTRREILRELGTSELAAGHIASRFDIAAPSVSRHLAILLGAGLVRQRRDGNRLFYSVESETLAHALNGFLSSVCPSQRIKRRRRQA